MLAELAEYCTYAFRQYSLNLEFPPSRIAKFLIRGERWVRDQFPEPGSIAHKPEFVQLTSGVKDIAAAGTKLGLVLKQGKYRVLVSGSSNELGKRAM